MKLPPRRLSHLAEGHRRRGRRRYSCKEKTGRSHASCIPSEPEGPCTSLGNEVEKEEEEEGRTGREDEAKKRKKSGSSVAATQARGKEKNKVDVRRRHKGLRGCWRGTEGGALCFPRSVEIGPSSTLECRFLLYLLQRVRRSRLALGNALLTALGFAIF